MITLMQDKHWKITLENSNEQFRFRIHHLDIVEINTTFMTFDKEILFIAQTVLKKIIKELDKNKNKSKYDSLELLGDVDGEFLVTIDLKEYHNFDLKFINYSSEFELELFGHASDFFYLGKAIDSIVRIVSDKNTLIE
ncbi:hypothetical protein [Bacillus sp. REN10]|uniref:hypothetical protein n=1 Tax=Bacillus sp. REN10 TaxID=2782541 RepID=UPI00193C7C41|nr:hypothetical protein [Bacillus sp. REN10]